MTRCHDRISRKQKGSSGHRLPLHAHVTYRSVVRGHQERTGQPVVSTEIVAPENHRAVKVIVDPQHVASLFDSVTQMDEIVPVHRQPSREFHIDAIGVTDIRNATELSQAKFATLIDVQVGTLLNWEQGRSEPAGPAKALLRAISKDPKNVLQALAG
jgi:putative transcriptional regulator